jgi:tetratricopeptide (TPR) repeat protein
LSFFLTFSAFDSKKLIVINDLNQQEKHITSFNRYLPPNSGEEPTFDADINTDTIQDRLYAAFHFSTFGWYVAALGSLFGIIAFIKSGISKKAKRTTLLLLMLLTPIYIALSLSSYLAAEYHRNNGNYYLAACNYSMAVEEYEHAKRLDPNIDYQKGFHNNLGKAYYFLSRNDKADYYFYKANIYLQEKNFPMAVFYFEKAESVEPSVSETIGNNSLSWAYVDYGLSEYRKGMASSAVELWRKSLETDCSQIQAYYFMSRAYYDTASYEKSIMSGLQFLKLCKNKIMKANVNSNIADSYYRLKDYGLAREHYLKSIFLDKYENVRAVTSLVGK